MILEQNILGLLYIISTYLVSKVLSKQFKIKSVPLILTLLIYFEFVYLSIFKILTFKAIYLFLFIHFAYLYWKREILRESMKHFKIEKIDLLVLSIYFPYFYLVNLSGFNFDDVLTAYLPRVDLWLQHQSFFIDINLENYYTVMLIYPHLGQLPLLLVEMFSFSAGFHILISLYITYSIIDTLRDFYKLSDKEFNIMKICILLSPIVILLSTTGLTDLIYCYFLINGFLYILKYLDTKNLIDLNLSILFTIVSFTIRYHGLISIIIIGSLVVYKTKDLEVVKSAVRYGLFYGFLIYGPHFLWILKNNQFDLFLSYSALQFNVIGTEKAQLIFSQNEYLKIMLFDSTELLRRVFNVLNSITHTTINFIVADLPFVFLFPDLVGGTNAITKFISYQADDTRTPGFVIFFSTAVFVTWSFLKLLPIKSKKIKEKIENKDLDKNFNKTLFLIFSSYFFLVSLRDFSTANFRYLFPIFILTFPLGIKLLKIDERKFLSIFILIFALIAGVQPIAMSDMLWAEPYPEFNLDSPTESSSTRGWRDETLRAVYTEFIDDYELIKKTINKDGTVIVLESKFPIGLIESSNKKYLYQNQISYINEEFFTSLNSNILITDNEEIKYDKNKVLFYNINDISILKFKKCMNPIILGDEYFSSSVDAFGYTEEDYKKGVRIYRFDAPIEGQEVFSSEKLVEVCDSGYSTTPINRCNIAKSKRESGYTSTEIDEYGYKKEDYENGIWVYRHDSTEKPKQEGDKTILVRGDEVFSYSKLLELCNAGYTLEPQDSRATKENANKAGLITSDNSKEDKYGPEIIKEYDYFILFYDY